MHNPNYNRHLMSKGKRSNKKIQRYGKYKTLSQRLIAEAKGLQDYYKRISKR